MAHPSSPGKNMSILKSQLITKKKKPSLKSQLKTIQEQMNVVQEQMSLIVGRRRGGEEEVQKRVGKGRKRKYDGVELNCKRAKKLELGSGWGTRIPGPVLVRIFSELVRIEGGCLPCLVRTSLVCKLWHSTITSTPSLWSHANLNQVKELYRLERNLIYLLETRFSNIKKLNLSNWTLSMKSIEAIVKHSKNLESINLSGCVKLGSFELSCIVCGCTGLRKVDLSCLMPPNTPLKSTSPCTPTSLKATLTQLSHHLTKLILSNNILNINQLIANLSEHCPNLQLLDLSNVLTSRKDIFKIETLQLGCSQLRVLRLINTELWFSDEERGFSCGWERLEELSLGVGVGGQVGGGSGSGGWQGIEDSDLERLVRNATNLKLLDVRGCTKLSDSAIVRIPAWDLKHLFLGGSTPSRSPGLELILRKWSHSFIELDLSYSSEVINTALIVFTESPNKLTTLNLVGSCINFNIVKLILLNTSLEYLDLSSCRGLPRGMKRVYSGGGVVRGLRDGRWGEG